MIIGLTGSIAMGKSTVADMFRQLAIPVFDSDAEVHRLYQPGAIGTQKIAKLYPEVISHGAVDREKLSKLVQNDAQILSVLEGIIHPLIKQRQDDFIRQHANKSSSIVVLDIPLLFETGRENDFDQVIVVSAPEQVQKKRALKRPGMTESKFETILAQQLADSEKRARADVVIDTQQTLERTFEQVFDLVKKWKLQEGG